MTALDALSQAWTADEAQSEKTYFGQVTILDAVQYVLQKGQPRRLYDPSIDRASDARVQIELTITSETRDGASYDIVQKSMDFDARWKDHTLPSLKKLGITPAQLKDAWVQIQRVPTGRKYEIRNGERAGQQADETAIVFVDHYADKAAMEAARTARFSQPVQTSGKNAPQPISDADLGGSDAERETAKQALQMLWQASGKTVATFEAMLNSNPMVSKYFTMQSPEVQSLLIPF